MPLLARDAIVLASSASSSSSVIAPVVALGASTEVSILNGPELLTVIGVVVVYVVEGTERLTAFGRLGMVPAALRVWLCCKHNHFLVLHVLGLGFLLLRVGSW